MVKQLYWVDNGDASYPRIVKCVPHATDGRSLAACKREILDRAESNARHWRYIVKSTRELKASDVEEYVPR